MSEPQAPVGAVKPTATIAQFLTFKLNDELYAVSVTQVREVLELVEITPVPRTPQFMRGVINLRGTVVPVADLKRKFEIGTTEAAVDTCIIVLELEVDGEPTVVGAMADAVQEVVDLPPEVMGPAVTGTHLKTEMVSSIAARGEEFIIILDIDRIFGGDELEAMGDATSGARADAVEGGDQEAPAAAPAPSPPAASDSDRPAGNGGA